MFKAEVTVYIYYRRENFSRKGSLKKGGGGNKCPKNEELRRHFNILFYHTGACWYYNS